MASQRTLSPAQLPISALMRRHFISIPPEESLLAAYQVMRLARVRVLPVVEGERLVGLLSFRDVVHALLAHAATHARDEGPGPSATVDSVMSGTQGALAPEEPATVAALQLCMLESGCLPVVEPGRDGPRIVGLLTETDLLRAAYG